MIKVSVAATSPTGLVSLIVYSPASSSNTFLIVNEADSSSRVFFLCGVGLTTVPEVNHSASGFGVPVNGTVNVTPSFSRTL